MLIIAAKTFRGAPLALSTSEIGFLTVDPMETGVRFWANNFNIVFACLPKHSLAISRFCEMVRSRFLTGFSKIMINLNKYVIKYLNINKY